MKFINWERRGNFNKRILELVWLQCIWDDYVCKIMCVFQEMYYVLENDKAQLKAIQMRYKRIDSIKASSIKVSLTTGPENPQC